jgi:hypothetical protein
VVVISSDFVSQSDCSPAKQESLRRPSSATADRS